MIDLTEPNRLEEERRTAEEARERASREQAVERAKSEAKDLFLATLSHELRTPLTPVVAALTDPTVLMSTPGRLRTILEMIRRNTVSLPTVPIEEIAMHPDAAITPPSDTNRAIRILLVEDHPDSAEILSQLLKTRGYHVQVAATVGDAFELAKGGCDLLISDIRLPDGSGLDLMRQISSQQRVRGIALSGFGTQQDERLSKDAGYQVHLTKPVNFAKLLEIIAQVAEEPEPMKS